MERHSLTKRFTRKDNRLGDNVRIGDDSFFVRQKDMFLQIKSTRTPDVLSNEIHHTWSFNSLSTQATVPTISHIRPTFLTLKINVDLRPNRGMIKSII